MKLKRFISLFLTVLMLTTLCLSSCREVDQKLPTEDQISDSGNSSAGNDDAADGTVSDWDSSSDTGDSAEDSSGGAGESDGENAEDTSNTKETEEVITDVMIGETLNAEPAANFTVAKVFSNDMVVQRNEHIRVWGFAPESENGKKVSGEFKGMFAEALIENGEWCITFGARLEADVNGADMKIYAGDNKTVTFTDVLVGDVFLVLGQSNAAYTVSNHLAYNKGDAALGGTEADINENSIIRLNYLNGSGGEYSKKGTDHVYSDLENTKYWTRTTSQDTLNFSALGYYFAVQMTQKDPAVPIGLMEVARGGAPIVSFLPNDLAKEFGGDYKDAISGVYYSNINTEHMGRYLYNCYLAPVSRYAVAGVLWYQGESNNSLQDAMKFNETFAALMTRLRSTHNVVNKDFPVFVAEFPSIYKAPKDFSGTWYFMELGIIRSYMGVIPTVLKNSYVSVSNDLWADRTFYNNLHPNCKYEQAGRMVALADAVINKNGTLDAATGPIFKSAELSADKKTIVITFTNVGEGLATKEGTAAVKGIVGLTDKSLGHSTVEPLSATITGKDQITVTFDTEIKAVAYNYASDDYYGETINLCNSYGCPASAFITPYEERQLGARPSSSLMDMTNRNLGLVGKSFDKLSADGKNLLNVGAVDSQLAAMDYVIDVYQGTNNLGLYGWVGFKHEILMFGYSIDDSDINFNIYPTIAGDAVLAAGGKQAVRFNVNMNIGELSLGEHTVTLAAYVDLKDGIAVRMLTFKINIIEKPTAPDGLELPFYKDPDYRFKDTSFDVLRVDSQKIYELSVDSKIASSGNTVSVKKGTTSVRFDGWIGFDYVIDSFGYSIDGGDAIMTFAPINAEAAVINRAGENAKRYSVTADISGLEAGLHSFDLLVKINADEEKATLILISFILEIK